MEVLLPIPESQLVTWNHLGSVQQSSATYNSIKQVLESKNAPYSAHRIDTFLQGSYCNDTNIYGDSDVDIVLRTRSFFHYNIDSLPDPQKAWFKSAHPKPAAYDLPAFKKDVIAWLMENYEGDLDTSGKKALRLGANGSRRRADILIVAPHKKFSRYINEQDQEFIEGVTFVTSDNVWIINYPKQHSENLTAKHQAADERLKPTIRVFKNMRNRAVQEGLLKEGAAPSYFIEGLLQSVPPEHFGNSFEDTVEACYSWIQNSDHGALMCANGQHPLVRDATRVSWPVQGYIDYLEAIRELWNGWE